MERYFKAAGTADNRKVALAAACLDPKLGPWWDQVEASVTDWAELKTVMAKQFQPVAQAELARNKLDNLSQRGAVTEYCSLFRDAILPIVGMSVDEQLHAFQRGLHFRIREKLEEQSTKPATLDDAMTRVVLIEERRKNFMRSVSRSPYQPFNSYRSSAPQHDAAAAAASPTAMDLSFMQQQDDCDYFQLWSDPTTAAPAAALNAITAFVPHRPTNRAPLVKLTDEERQKLMSENRCFRCRQTGHRAFDCPKRNNTKGSNKTTPAQLQKNG
jgi:hypothetical protein